MPDLLSDWLRAGSHASDQAAARALREAHERAYGEPAPANWDGPRLGEWRRLERPIPPRAQSLMRREVLTAALPDWSARAVARLAASLTPAERS